MKKTKKRNRSIWITVEATEIIEMKRIVLDHDVAEAADFFQAVIAPQVIAAAERIGIHLADAGEADDGRLPG